MSFQLIYPAELPRPKGHYSPGVVHNQTVYVSGQLPFNRDGDIELGTVEEQTELCLRNMEAILLASGSDFNHVLKVTVYLTDVEHWPLINAVYARLFGDHRPARAVVPVGPLHYGAAVEIECIAAVKD